LDRLHGGDVKLLVQDSNGYCLCVALHRKQF
jgi:hypothetical protein